jgi:hypothetical protein
LSKIIENPKRQILRNNEYYDFQGVQDQLYAQSHNGKIFTNLMSKITDRMAITENLDTKDRNTWTLW